MVALASNTGERQRPEELNNLDRAVIVSVDDDGSQRREYGELGRVLVVDPSRPISPDQKSFFFHPCIVGVYVIGS